MVVGNSDLVFFTHVRSRTNSKVVRHTPVVLIAGVRGHQTKLRRMLSGFRHISTSGLDASDRRWPFSAIFALVTYDGRLWKITRRPPLLLPVLPKPEVVF